MSNFGQKKTPEGALAGKSQGLLKGAIMGEKI